MTRAALGRPSSVACLSPWFFHTCVRRGSLPPEDRTPASYPCSPEQTRSAPTLKPRHRAGCQPHPRSLRKACPLATDDPCHVRQGWGPRSSAPGTLTGQAASCQRGLMPLGQCMRRNDARGSAVCTGRAYARQGMMASTVFFSALGWAGDVGAFFRARSSLAPSSCSCLRPRPARTLGNQSCSSSSM
jgi:hypothetical protein